MKLSLIAIVTTVFLLSACSSNCITCTNQNTAETVFDACEEDGVNYTDSNGNVIAFDEIANHYESIGFDCN